MTATATPNPHLPDPGTSGSYQRKPASGHTGSGATAWGSLLMAAGLGKYWLPAVCDLRCQSILKGSPLADRGTSHWKIGTNHDQSGESYQINLLRRQWHISHDAPIVTSLPHLQCLHNLSLTQNFEKWTEARCGILNTQRNIFCFIFITDSRFKKMDSWAYNKAG